MKIIVTHVPAGAGHQKAAEAISVALKQLNPQIDVRLFDSLEGMDAYYRWSFTKGYLTLIDRLPRLWGLAYYLTDFKPLRPLMHQIHHLSNSWHGKELERKLIQHQADVIIGTHFFPMEVAASLKTAGRLSARLITVITDYLPHLVWTAPGVDSFVVGSDEGREALLARGIPQDRIQVLGIPIDPKFGLTHNRQEVAGRLGIDPNRATVLIVAGGFGSGPVLSLVQNLGKVRTRLQLLVVAGKNDTLFRQLNTLRGSFPHPMKPFPFVDNLDELMDVSDLIVTKPGGLTCAEALAKGLPLVLLPTIPGQETRNAKLLIRAGAALEANHPSAVSPHVQQLLENPTLRHTLVEKGKRFSRPEAALEIAREILDHA